jgi:hypothetical protein
MAWTLGEDFEDEELDVAPPCAAAPAAHPTAESMPKAVPEVAMALVVVPGVFKKLFHHVAIVKDISRAVKVGRFSGPRLPICGLIVRAEYETPQH